jgi:hypothetical protein
MTSRKKPGAAFWATVGLVVVLEGYPLSFGPACWATSRFNAGEQIVSHFYRPITIALPREPGTGSRVSSIFRWYSRLGASGGWEWVLVSELPERAQNDADWRWGPVPIF